jgi:hypothetical protein
MTSKINRRTVLGGLATAAAMTSVTDLRARAANGDLDIGSLDLEPMDAGTLLTSSDVSFGEATAVTPGYRYDRYSAIEFMPAAITASVGYTSVSGGIRHNAAESALHICPLRADHGTRVRELQFYIETGTAAAEVALLRHTSIGVGTLLSQRTVAALPVFQTVTLAVDHLVDIIDADYELWVTFHNSGTLRGARVGSIVPATGLVTVAQNRKLDTRGLDKPVLGSITTVELAPDIPLGARTALVNITATQTVDGGFVTAFPGTQVVAPTTSSLNWTASNVDIANAAVVQLENGTTIKLAVGGGPTAAAHLICDVLGYFI